MSKVALDSLNGVKQTLTKMNTLSARLVESEQEVLSLRAQLEDVLRQSSSLSAQVEASNKKVAEVQRERWVGAHDRDWKTIICS